MNDQEGFAIAVEEANLSYREGGVPIGAALVSKDGKLLGRGHNMRVQKGSAIHHGETSALENSGRLPASAYKGATMFTTLSPCDMWYGNIKMLTQRKSSQFQHRCMYPLRYFSCCDWGEQDVLGRGGVLEAEGC